MKKSMEESMENLYRTPAASQLAFKIGMVMDCFDENEDDDDTSLVACQYYVGQIEAFLHAIHILYPESDYFTLSGILWDLQEKRDHNTSNCSRYSVAILDYLSQF